ncbi:hypothetical protein [Sunxiuqinia dokdonensis]|uniref:Uncharacterized protein n=1 Tax=Sunxiuqinia dokdonensis TaxID=1409788 RepID=A0A0L8VD03_9BACT|nr:hypothetical protein [Sunxiuqinia dokdonensis]KOH46218.1 hypothetical protein NC99_09960 [Sunxiuqinia dokdonensis]
MKRDLDIRIGTHEPDWIIPGPSSLYYIASGAFRFNSSFRFAIPDNLMRLLDFAAQGSDEHIRFLSRIVLEDHADQESLPADEIISNLRGIFRELQSLDRLLIIADEAIEPSVEEAIAGSFGDSDYEIALSPRRNFIREYFTKALSWSKKNGAVIIESTKKSFVALGDYIVSLQLPQKVDAIVEDKQSFMNRLFSFDGGKGVQWVIGVSIAVGGLSVLPIGAVGVGLAFIDP